MAISLLFFLYGHREVRFHEERTTIYANLRHNNHIRGHLY